MKKIIFIILSIIIILLIGSRLLKNVQQNDKIEYIDETQVIDTEIEILNDEYLKDIICEYIENYIKENIDYDFNSNDYVFRTVGVDNHIYLYTLYVDGVKTDCEYNINIDGNKINTISYNTKVEDIYKIKEMVHKRISKIGEMKLEKLIAKANEKVVESNKNRNYEIHEQFLYFDREKDTINYTTFITVTNENGTSYGYEMLEEIK